MWERLLCMKLRRKTVDRRVLHWRRKVLAECESNVWERLTRGCGITLRRIEGVG